MKSGAECVRPAFVLLEKFDAEDLSAAAAQFDGALSLYAKEYEKAGLKPNVFDSIEAQNGLRNSTFQFSVGYRF